jgi:hypothetical protein
MAIQRTLVLVPNQGIDQCCALDVAHESGTDIGKGRVLGICPNRPDGLLRKIDSGICQSHIEQYDREGGWVLE